MQRKACFFTASFIGLLIYTKAAAQQLGVELDGGLQGMHYSLQNGQTQPLFGGSAGLRYGFPLNGRVNLVTGASIGVYRTRATLRDGVAFSSYQVDDAGSAFQFNVKTVGYKEIQRFYALSIPLLLQYHTQDPIVQWYVEGGGKLLVPFGEDIQVSANQLNLSGYYPDYNIEVSNLPQHGFGTVNDWKSTAAAKFSAGAALSAATGASFALAPGMRVYAGVYVDYGLTSLKAKGDSMPIATYNSTGLTAIKAGSVLSRSGAGRASLLAFGLQVRLTFGAAGSKRVTPESQQPAKDTLSGEQRETIEETVVFGLFGESALPEIQKRHLDEVAVLLQRFPALHISIVGHICNSDTEAEDRRVGVDRAGAVAQYLRSKGIEAGRMNVSPVPESEVFDPSNPLANYRSRHVTIKVL